MERKRIAVLTGGGDCPGLNAVLRAVVKTAMFCHNYEVLGFKDGYKGLALNDYKILGIDDVSGILDKGGTILGTSNKDNPFKFRIKKKNGEIEIKDMSDKIIKTLSKMKVECLICIGGDGTLTSARDFYKKGLNVIGVPKTIDNDLSGTDITFGFRTAVNTATEAIDKLHSTAESHHRVIILEVMGRYAGWIALESGIAGGADVILIPEIPYDLSKIDETIKKREKAGKHFSIVVVAEGAKEKGGKMIISEINEDLPDPIILGGVGNRVADEIDRYSGMETRVTVLGHLQRGGRPTPLDRILSTRFGVKAMEMAKDKIYGEMVCLKGNNISSVTLEKAVGILKTVNLDNELISIARKVGVGFGD